MTTTRRTSKRNWRTATVAVLAPWMLASVCAAADVDTDQSAAPESDATTDCLYHEIYEYCFETLEDCHDWTYSSPQVDACEAGSFVSTVCPSGYDFVSYVCP